MAYFCLDKTMKPKEQYIAYTSTYSKNDPTKILKTGRSYIKICSDKGGSKELELDENHQFNLIPAMDGQRWTIAIQGASGDGKTLLINNLCITYKKLYPKNNVIFITTQENIDYDKALNREEVEYIFYEVNDFINRIQGEYDSSVFKDSFVIFDDIDGTGDGSKENKEKEKVLWAFINKGFEIFRKLNCSICLVYHGINGRQVSRMVREIKYYISFPSLITNSMFSYYLKLDRDVMKKISSIRKSQIRNEGHQNFLIIAIKKYFIMTKDKLFFI